MPICPKSLLVPPPCQRPCEERLFGDTVFTHAREMPSEPVNLRPVQGDGVYIIADEELMAFAVQTPPVLAHVLVRETGDTNNMGSHTCTPRAQATFLPAQLSNAKSMKATSLMCTARP